jgi:hypothetical protein
MYNCYAWATTKTPTGYVWHVSGFNRETPRETIVLREGVCLTRAMATRIAKKHVLFFRRNVKKYLT